VRCLYLAPKLLDLFCKAGGAGAGYHLAGFDVVGVDIEPQPHYPFEFIQADAIDYLKTADLSRFDVIHASPPCQAFSRIQSLGTARNGSYRDHPDLVEPTRKLLINSGLPYIIENVAGAPLIDPIRLCGSMFGLKVYRHRIFESNQFLLEPDHFPHRDSTPSAGNGKSPKGFICVCGTGGVRGMTAKEVMEYWSMAMGIDWMNRAELAQAIPPAFTECLGRQLLVNLRRMETVAVALESWPNCLTIGNNSAGE
jgi:DNA (cytosine-5)-methyltransferase 1